MKLFLDADVLFTAAHNPNGKAALVMELGSEGHWQLVTSNYAAEEARRNLAKKTPQALPVFALLIQDIPVVRHQLAMPTPTGLPAKDRPIFQAALAAEATHLLTGDLKHFGALMNRPDATSGVLVQTVADFLDQRLGNPRADEPLTLCG